MTIFMFLFFPLMLTLYCFCYRSHKNVPVIFIGIIASVIISAVKMLFFYSHRIVPYSFTENFVYFLVRESLLPGVIFYSLFFFFSKDDLEFKIDSVFPLLTSFYTVYLPYCIYNSPTGFNNYFSLFIKPILYGIMIITMGICARKIYNYIKEKNIWLGILFGAICIVYMFVPSLLESYYLMTTSIVGIIIFTIIYGALPCVLLVLKALGKIRINNK